jgi:soluble P-type ATPase
MAVTFTNKAAAEMRHRIGQLMGTSQGGMWVGTFHGLAHRLLRAHHMDANLPQDFQILDSEDQLRLLKRLIKAMNLDEKQWPPRQAMWYINSQKDEGLRPHHIQSYGNPVEQTWQKVYQAYQEACDRAGLVDFAELLLRAHELWLNKPHILQHYRERFTNILVDEFQDTNNIQYAWIRLLAGDTGKVMIVGDDDQSIYGWRGAQVENIQRFLNDFPGAETIRLEQNYRSTSNILSAANALIENNNGRLGKKLWTDGADGEPISLYCAFNELDEARFVVNRIKTWQDNGGALAECASSHPISKSLQKAYGKEIDRSRVTDIEEVSGRGILAKVDGVSVAAGNHKLMEQLGIDFIDCHSVGTIIHMAVDGKYAGHIVISDVVKPNSKKAIEQLHRAGVTKTVMLTGDAKKVADSVAKELGVDEVYSDLLPAGKVEKVEALLSRQSGKAKLAFVGDGINDAPVLSRADIGIAMGAMGSDAAIEAADIVLMDDEPLQIAKAIKISRKCIGIVYQNIVFALMVKFACLALVALGAANMWAAIFADVGVMVLAVLNAIRALRVHNL